MSAVTTSRIAGEISARIAEACASDPKGVARAAYAELSAKYAPATVKNIIGAAKRKLVESGNEQEAKHLASESAGGVIPNALYDDLGRRKQAALWTRHNNLRELDAERFLSTAKACISSDDPHMVALGLMAVTGRRFAEVLFAGEFSGAGKRTDAYGTNSVMFSGQTKTRNAPGTQQGAYRIPTLIPGRSVIEAHGKLKQMMEAKGMRFASIEECQAALSNAIGAKAKRCFGGLDWTPKSLRAAYAAIAYEAFGRAKKKSPLAFYSIILGHKNSAASDKEGGDLETPLSYFVFQVKGGWKPKLSKYLHDLSAQT